MIIDKIANLKNYPAFGERLARGLDIICNTDFENIKDGKYIVDVDNIFYSVSRYKTRTLEQSRFEAHKKYIDIQFIAKGEELFGHSPLEELNMVTPYDDNNDIAFYDRPVSFSKIKFSQGMFAIVWPQDGHMPCVSMDQETDVLKIVVKVRTDG